MKKKIFTSSYLGLESYLVEVEVDISRGLPIFSIVGMGDTAILESKFRVKAALKNSDYEIVPQKIVVNLSPAGIKKEGAQFDLPIALGIILEMKLLKDKKDIFKDYLFVGELSLDGEVKGVSGTINSVILAKEKGFKGIVVPYENRNEASLIDGVDIVAVKNVADVVNFIENGIKLEFEKINLVKTKEDILDFQNSFNFLFNDSSLREFIIDILVWLNALLTRLTIWNLSNTISALGKIDFTKLIYGEYISIQIYFTLFLASSENLEKYSVKELSLLSSTISMIFLAW